MRVAGIMSGTSLDGIDVALVDIRGRKFHTLAFTTTPYPRAVRDALLGVSNTDTHTSRIARLHFLLPELYARALRRTSTAASIPLESVELIGCHGQTIFHEGAPVRYLGHRVASTLQIGEGSVLRERTGIPVVCDFRPADIAAGGRGAPLVPFVDYRLFRHPKRGRIALNLGGIGNITAIPPGAAPEQVVAFDTGPGNMVIDALVSRYTNGRFAYDRGGAIAARGRLNQPLLDELLRDPYYSAPPPKSAGREQYGTRFVDRLISTGLPLEDLIATATALTAATAALGVERFGKLNATRTDLIVSGGGAHNARIMAYLAAFLPRLRVTTSAEFGIDVDAKEAIAFALLAAETWRRVPANLPSATGARHPVILGKIIC